MSKVSNTLYISQIGDKVGLVKLKRTLFTLFSPYGQILDISAHKSMKLHGQAWLTYYSVDSAVAAKKDLDQFYLFDKPIHVEFSKNKSYVTMKMNGTYNPYGRKAEAIKEEEAAALAHGPIPLHWFYEMKSDSEEEEETEQSYSTTTITPLPAIGLTPPNNILFVQKLPPEIDTQVLDLIFRQFAGYRESRLIESRPGIAFVEYGTINQATVAMDHLNGFAIDDDHQMVIQYAKS